MASETQDLILQVQATQELLDRQLAQCGKSVESFEAAAEIQIDRLEKRFSGLNVSGAINAVKDADKAFKTSFGNINQLAGDLARTMSDSGQVDLSPLIAQGKQRVAMLQSQAQAQQILATAMQNALAPQEKLTVEEKASLAAARASVSASQDKVNAASAEVAKLEQLWTEIQRLNGAQDQQSASNRRGAVSVGQHRAAMQQFSYQISDTATSFATLGFKTSSFFMIFAQQGSQFVQAASLMQAESKGFIGFLGGPWGAVIMGAVSVLGLVVSKHYEAADAQKEHKKAADQLQQAIERLNASSAAANHETEIGIQADIAAANAKREKARATLDEATAQLKLLQARQKANNDQASRGGGGGEGGGAAAAGAGALATVNAGEISSQLDDISKAKRALGESSKAIVLGYGKLADRRLAAQIDPQQAIQNRYDDARARAQKAYETPGTSAFGDLGKRNSAIVQADKVRDAQLKAYDPTGSKARAAQNAKDALARKEETARQKALSDDISYTSMEREARKKLIDATTKTATNEAERDQMVKDDIDSEKQATEQKIKDRLQKGQITAIQAQHLTTLAEQLASQKKANVDYQAMSRAIQQQATMEEHSLDAKIAMLQIEGSMADTARERKRVALQILAYEQQLARQRLQAIQDDPTRSQFDRDQAGRDLDALKQRQGAETASVARQNETPTEQYLRNLKKTPEQINEAIDGIKVEGMQSLNEELTQAIMGTKSLGDAFSAVASQIVADLIRIAIQKTIVNALGNVLFSGIGGGGGSSSSWVNPGAPAIFAADGALIPHFDGGGMFRGPGGPRTDNLLAAVSPGEFIINEASTRAYLPLIQAINQKKLPRFANGGMVGALGNFRTPQIRNADIAPASGSSVVKIQVEANDYFDARVDHRAAGVAAPMATRAGLAGASIAEGRINRKRRNTIPG
ncbi:MAG TPA: hypothetical protein VF503_01355 [Sphingobium sp.]|uniref:hypothetical protein n=1 Tax=Sphingobium sp. TaxID=1912891 RepID=UPI002ED5BCE8